MDLALELGMTVGQVKANMTEHELAMWHVYASRKRLPTRRLELYLAQIAQAHAGGDLGGWMIADRLMAAAQPEAERPRPAESDVAAETLSSMVGGIGIRYVGRKKKAEALSGG